MTKRFELLVAMVVTLLPSVAFANDLMGQVVLVGPNDELTTAVGVAVTLEETGDTVRTKAQGKFRLPLPDFLKPGETVTVLVDMPEWRIQYPLDGETCIPADLDRETIEVRLLPADSKRFWSDDRIEKYIADSAEKRSNN